MAINVEDGTGLSNAETYASLAEFRAYCDARGYDDTAATDDTVEQKLRIAAEYIDGNYRFKATRLKSTQALEFPRDGLTDWSGHAVTGVPQRLKNATIELAFKAVTDGTLFADQDKTGVIKSETVGPISVTYGASSSGGADGALAVKTYTVADRMLAQYLYTGKLDRLNGPELATTGDPFFSIGMHDNVAPTSDLLSEQ